MKTAIIYYSLDGNSRLTANIIRDEVQGDIYEIETLDNKKRRGLYKVAWGVFQVMRNKIPPIRPQNIDLNAYDLIILGSPVWAGSPAPALVSFIKETSISGKRLALFCSHAGSIEEFFSSTRNLLPDNSFAGELAIKNPAKMDRENLQKIIKDWVKTLSP